MYNIPITCAVGKGTDNNGIYYHREVKPGDLSRVEKPGLSLVSARGVRHLCINVLISGQPEWMPKMPHQTILALHLVAEDQASLAGLF